VYSSLLAANRTVTVLAVDVVRLQLSTRYTASLAAGRVESLLSIRRCPGSLLIYKDKLVFGRTVSGRETAPAEGLVIGSLGTRTVLD
jgi:hypothetical protein